MLAPPFGFQHVEASYLGQRDKPLYITNPCAIPKARSFCHILLLHLYLELLALYQLVLPYLSPSIASLMSDIVVCSFLICALKSQSSTISPILANSHIMVDMVIL